jgi:thiamine pyrophosphokinase
MGKDEGGRMKDDRGRHVLVLLDGEEPSKSVIDRFLKYASHIIATDGAAKYALNHDIPLDIIIGDMDSLSVELKKSCEAKGTRIIEDPDQYSNDFEKALRYILADSLPKNAIILGIHGKRTDHLLTNFSVMLRFTDRFESLIAYDATHEHHFLTTKKNRYSFSSSLEMQISLTPLPEANGVTTSGLYYPIVKEQMIFGQSEGLSNIIAEKHASVEIRSGALLISVPYSN